MREVIYGGATSLDQFLARPDHGIDWLRWSAEVEEMMAAFWPRIDTVLMGRKTYDFAVAMGRGGSMPGVATYVFSRTIAPPPYEDVHLVRDDAAGFVRSLKAQPGRDICMMGGGDLARTLFEADLIDEIGCTVHPVLLGRGIAAFQDLPRQVDLELLECRPLSTGCVSLRYRVLHPA